MDSNLVLIIIIKGAKVEERVDLSLFKEVGCDASIENEKVLGSEEDGHQSSPLVFLIEMPPKDFLQPFLKRLHPAVWASPAVAGPPVAGP